MYFAAHLVVSPVNPIYLIDPQLYERAWKCYLNSAIDNYGAKMHGTHGDFSFSSN